MSEQQEQTAYEKIREQKEIRQLGTGELPKQGSHVTLNRLKNVSAWKPREFKYNDEVWFVECKQFDALDNIVAIDDIPSTPEVDAYIRTRSQINKQTDIDDEEKKQLRDQAWENLTDQQRVDVVRCETHRSNAILIGAIRFPQEEPDTYLYLSFETSEDTIDIKSLDQDFIEALHLVYQDVNYTEEVISAVDRFLEVGEEEQKNGN